MRGGGAVYVLTEGEVEEKERFWKDLDILKIEY